MGEAVLTRAALTGHYANLKRLQAIVIDREADRKEKLFRNRYRPESTDLASMTTRLLFCSHAAYTVRRSAESTAIWGSNWPEPDSNITCGVCQVLPLSLLATSNMVGTRQPLQSATCP